MGRRLFDRWPHRQKKGQGRFDQPAAQGAEELIPLGPAHLARADGDEQRMMLMGLRRFTKYTNMPNIVALRETITTKLVAENKYCF